MTGRGVVGGTSHYRMSSSGGREAVQVDEGARGEE
jgi:hypothetical protein